MNETRLMMIIKRYKCISVGFIEGLIDHSAEIDHLEIPLDIEAAASVIVDMGRDDLKYSIETRTIYSTYKAGGLIFPAGEVAIMNKCAFCNKLLSGDLELSHVNLDHIIHIARTMWCSIGCRLAYNT